MTTTTTHLTPAELDALLEVARAATPGPWQTGDMLRHIVYDGNFSKVAQCENPTTSPDETAAFIAAANPATIERLVLMVRELQTQLEWSSSANQLLGGAVNGTAQFTLRAIEHFRARAVGAILTHQPKYASTVVDDVIGALAQVIESLPLVETEGE